MSVCVCVCVYLGGQLVEEVQSQAGDVMFGVNEQHSHFTDLTFDLEHILKHQLS